MESRSLAVGALVASAMTVAALPAMAGGVGWNRNTNWVPGTSQGSSQGNPGPGPGGGFVWRYEWTNGGPLDSGDPWYLEPRNLSTWDASWYATNMGAWSKGDNVSPPIMQDRSIHNLHTSTYADIPVLSWINPLGEGTLIDITGSLRLRWSGGGGIGFPVDVDVVLAVFNVGTQTTTPLLSQTYSKPTPMPTIEEEITIPLNFLGLNFDTYDQLILTHRGRVSFGPLGLWVSIFDEEMNLTLVPSPGTAALLGLAGLAAMRRRRH